MNLNKIKGVNYIPIILFFLLFIFPFFYIALFNFSGAADDMYFAVRTPHLGYFEKIFNSYNNYIGRYFNAFFFSLPSNIFMSVPFAQLHPIADLLLLFASFRYFIIRLGLKSKRQIWTICLITFAVILAFMPNIKTLYWFAGSTVYFFPFSGFIFLLGLLIKDFNTSLIYIEYLILYLLIFAVSGSNEIFMVFVLYSTLLLIILKFLYNRPKKHISIIAFLFSAYCTYLVLDSPGTERRFVGEGVGNLIDVITSLFPITAALIWDWLFKNGLILIPFILMFGGLFKGLKITNKMFLFYISYAFTLIIGGVFVVTYSLGSEKEILPRVVNIFFILFIFILISIGIYFSKNFKYKTTNQIIFWAALSFLFFAKSDNISNVHEDLSKGIAKKAQKESIWRFSYLDTINQKEVIMPRLTQKSKVLMIPDWGSANDWTNKHMATYFNKKSISVNHKISVSQYIKGVTSNKITYQNAGFNYWYDKLNNQIVVQHNSGDKSKRFLLHLYPTSEDNQPQKNADFDNFDFSFPMDKESVRIDLPKYSIKRLLIGQFSNQGRIWTHNIIIDYRDYLYDI